MPSTSEILIDTLAAARRDRSLIELASLPVPATQAEGLAVQAEIANRLGQDIAGWKVAIAEDGSPAAGIMPGLYLKPGDTYEGAIGAEVRVEIEIALRLAEDVPRRPERPYSRAELLGLCDKAYLGIELVESRIAGWNGLVAFPLWLCDAMGHGGYILGSELHLGVLDDVTGANCLISLNGVTIYDKPALHGNGDPMAPFLAWANRRSDVLGPLKAGQIVTTGSLCGGVLAPGKGEVLTRLTPHGDVAFTLR